MNMPLNGLSSRSTSTKEKNRPNKSLRRSNKIIIIIIVVVLLAAFLSQSFGIQHCDYNILRDITRDGAV